MSELVVSDWHRDAAWRGTGTVALGSATAADLGRGRSDRQRAGLRRCQNRAQAAEHHKLLPSRHGTGSHFVTQRPSDPGIQRPGDPVDLVTLFYNELQMSTYVADKRLQWAKGLPVFIAVWRLHASGK